LQKNGPVAAGKDWTVYRKNGPVAVTRDRTVFLQTVRSGYNRAMINVLSSSAPDRTSPHWWNERYREQDVPWDTGVVPPELHELVDTGLLRPPGVALDLGCGTGTNVAFLTHLGFTAFGVDFALLALVSARQKAREAGLSANFCLGDVADLGFLDVQASFALDMGCLHSLLPEARARYADSLAQRLHSGGIYLLYGFDFNPTPQGGPSGFDTDEIGARFGAGFALRWRRPSTQGARAVAWYLLQRR
jgi:SAM-dependent methyltransferase